MKIKEILKQLTPERIKREIEEIQKTKLPLNLQRWIKEYEKVGRRSEFLWKWIYKANKTVVGSFNIPSKYYCSIVETTYLFHMFTNLIDDISERRSGRNLLDELLKIPFNQNNIRFNRLDKRERTYLTFTIQVWRKIERNLKNSPYYKKMRYIFEYDVYQLLNTTRYSFLIRNNPYLINKTEYWMYLPQNMQFINFFDFCLMYSKFNFKDITKLREVILYTQRMARIGNDIGTWEREIKNGDFANCICIYSLDSEIFSIDEFKKGNKLEIIKRIKASKIEKEILEEWERNYRKIKEINEKSKLIDTRKFLSALEKITFYHLLSRGYI